MRLNLKALGLSFGIVWAGAVFLSTLLSVPTGYGRGFLELLSSIYPGYSISWAGSVIGLVYAFVDGFICALIFGAIYTAFIPAAKE
jgi:undecaprenyl pyrophosphate phosphatase UppP